MGSHVRAGEVLARLNDTEQQADVSVARAALKSAKSGRQTEDTELRALQALLQSQAIAKQIFDGAQEELLSAQASLDAAEATLATAEDALSYTELKADADGIITARTIEVGQVVSAAQSAFTLAHDGPRDAVFDVFEAFFLDGRPLADVDVAPVGGRADKVHAKIREMSPLIGTTGRHNPHQGSAARWCQWALGTSVVGTLRSSPHEGIVLPYNAIASAKGEPAVWLVDTQNSSVSLRKISVARYRKGDIVVTGGIASNDLVVTEGGKFLREGQAVAWEGK